MGVWCTRGVTGATVASLATGSLEAQALRGTVVREDGTTPAAQVIVEAMSGADRRRAITNVRGNFRLDLRAGVTWQVRALRIGFRPTDLAPLVMPASDTTVRIVLHADPIVLTRVTVAGRSSCRTTPDSGRAIAAVWEEARTAMLATTLAGFEGHEATVVTWDRTLDGDSTVLTQQVHAQQTSRPRVSRAIDVDSLERLGYAFVDDERVHLFGPDPDVLLADRFVESHCLSLVPAADGDTTKLGIRFAPARRGPRTDIEGVLHLERATARLLDADFRYVGLPRGMPESQEAGGILRFAWTRDGEWFVEGWRLQWPAPEENDAVMQHIGGDVHAVVFAGDTVFRGASARLTGVVLREEGGVVSGARVLLLGTDYMTNADDAGRFTLENLVPGRYRVTALTPTLDSLGTGGRIMIADLRRVTRLDLRIPAASAGSAVMDLCGPNRSEMPAGLLRGRVIERSTGRVLPETEVTIDWLMPRHGEYSRANRSRLRTGPDGSFNLCGAPKGWRFLVRAVSETHSGETTVEFPRTRWFVTVELPLVRR